MAASRSAMAHQSKSAVTWLAGKVGASVWREVDGRDAVEDRLDLIANGIGGAAHAVGHEADIRQEAHRQVVGRSPAADERLDPERVRAAGHAQVVREVVDHRPIGQQHLGAVRQLELLLHLGHQDPQLRLRGGGLVQAELVEADHLAPDPDRSPRAANGACEGVDGVRQRTFGRA